MTNPPLGPVLDRYEVVYRHDREGWQKIRCPVHEDRTPSCSLNLSFGFIECHACPFRGTAVDLVMEKEGLGRAEAFKLVQRLTGHVPDTGQRSGRVRTGTGFRPVYRRVNRAARSAGSSWVG